MTQEKQDKTSVYNQNRKTIFASLALGSIIPVALTLAAPIKYYVDMPDVPDAERAESNCFEQLWNGTAQPEPTLKAKEIESCTADKIAEAVTAKQDYITNESPLTRTDMTSIVQTGLVSLVFWGCAGVSGVSNMRLRRQDPDIAKKAKKARNTAIQDSPVYNEPA